MGREGISLKARDIALEADHLLEAEQPREGAMPHVMPITRTKELRVLTGCLHSVPTGYPQNISSIIMYIGQ